MIAGFARRSCDTLCTIEIEHSEQHLHAHVELDGESDLRPGDRVHVHGAPIRVSFGERLTLRRPATVERAHWLERQWTRLAARFEITELYEISFHRGDACEHCDSEGAQHPQRLCAAYRHHADRA